ncbi:MAG: hypothetical protein J5675_04020 [Bacteroidales bacterium]|nr:hypothetical protein [Bacteroidales bacterium]
MNKIALVAALLLSAAGASAQSFRSGYFLDNYIYGYRINPAQINRKSFFSLGTGNIDLQNNLNVGVASLLFPTENGLVTGFNKAVSAEEFLGGLPESTLLSMDENINLISSGRVKRNSMTTFEVNVRAMANMALPRELFAFLKQGGDRAYDISGINLSAGLIGDASYGFAHRLGKNLSFGARFHFLMDVADLRAYSVNSSITMGAAQTKLDSELHLQTSGMLSLGTDDNGNLDFSKTSINGPIFSSYGGGVDLGIEIRSGRAFRLFASVTELGAMRVKNTTDLVANSSITYTGMDVKYEDGEVKADYEAILEKLQQAIIFTDAQSGTRLERLPYNLSAGFKLNMLGLLSIGALATYHTDVINPWYDVRAGATVSLGTLLSASANAGVSTFGPTLGGAVNVNLLGINVIAGVDAFRGDVGTLSGLPVDLPFAVPVPLHAFNLNAHVGLAFNFGKAYKDEYQQKTKAKAKEPAPVTTESEAARRKAEAAQKLEDMKRRDEMKKIEDRKKLEEKNKRDEVKQYEKNKQLEEQLEEKKKLDEEQRKRDELKLIKEQRSAEEAAAAAAAEAQKEAEQTVVEQIVEVVAPSEQPAEPAKEEGGEDNQ